MIRIHFTYRHVERPWGGANNFIRALRNQLADETDYCFIDRLEDPSDIVFMNQLSAGPGAGGTVLSVRQVRRVAAEGRCIAVRAVNLNRHAFGIGPRNAIFGWLRDRNTIALLSLARVTIFQSAYQKAVFCEAGYRGAEDVVIHNGADPIFWNPAMPRAASEKVLRIVSSTASDRETKRHDLIAAISRVPGVEVLHCGNWPRNVDVANVRLVGMLRRESMARLFAEAHVFLHPAIKDPCPNVVFEAICAGLPVIYHPGPSSSAEVVGANGMALDEAHPSAVIALLRMRLSELQEIVRANRNYYRIERASAAYSKLFRSLASARR